MEAILGLIFVFGIIFAFNFVLSAGARTVKAAARTAVGKGSFSENMELAFKGMKALELRFSDERLGENHDGPLAKKIEVRGLFPVQSRRRVGFVTSVFDNTSGKFEPVISALDEFQEEKSRVYQNSVEVGYVNPNEGFIKWVRVGVVLPDLLATPYSGERKLCAILRLVDFDNPPDITHGFHQPKDARILWQGTLEFVYIVKDKGYQEAAEHRNETQGLLVKIGLFLAVKNGKLVDAKGEMLKGWITKALAALPEDRRGPMKNLYNAAMKEAYIDATSGSLSLSVLTERLNTIAEKSVKYEVIELCFDLTASSGGTDSEDLRQIRQIAAAFGLRLDEIEKIRDQKIVKLKGDVSSQLSIEDLLGIEPDWATERIKKHLRDEFQKWNNRLTTLSEGEERENVQRMLNLIAQARQKYG